MTSQASFPLRKTERIDSWQGGSMSAGLPCFPTKGHCLRSHVARSREFEADRALISRILERLANPVKIHISLSWKEMLVNSRLDILQMDLADSICMGGDNFVGRTLAGDVKVPYIKA